MTPPLIVLLVLIVLGLIWLVYLLIWGTPPSINWAVEKITLRRLWADPETLTVMGVVDNTWMDFHSSQLTDISPRYMAKMRRLDREGLALIRRYGRKPLEGQDAITYQLMCWYFKQNLEGHRFPCHWVADPVFMGPYPVNPVFGVQIGLIQFLCTYHKIDGRQSVRRYVKRLQSVPWKVAGLMESLIEKEEANVLPPRFVVKKSLAQIDDFLAYSTEENPLYTSFMRRMLASQKASEPVARHFGDRVKKAIEREVIPAYRSLSGYLQEWLEKAPEQDGVWRLPEGSDYYDFLLRTHTTTDLSAEEIYQLGLDEVEKLTKSLQEALYALGLPSDEPGLELRRLMENPEFAFSGEDCREEILNTYQAILDEVNEHMSEIFTHGELDKIVVERLAEYKELDSPIAYAQPPSMDGSRPGTMWVNLREPRHIYRWGMRTLAYHEGIPGHVYQLAQAQKIRGLPTFRRAYSFNAYIEGWALYAERLGWELGLENEFSNLGRLQALLWRAARLVVDTGIHAKRWTRQEAIDYMVEKTGLPERDVVSEVERYIVMPGQACAYYIGYLKMAALRHKAETVLGTLFDLKEFHDVVLNSGSLPLTLLESLVDDYIDRKSQLYSPEQLAEQR